jgi:hypothetical protein
LIHGKNCCHNYNECHALKFQAEKKKQTHAAQHPGKKEEHKERQELNVMVAEAVGNAMKDRKNKERKKFSESDKLAEENFNFAKLTKTSDDEELVTSITANSSSLSDSSEE